MPEEFTVKVTGYRETALAFRAFDVELQKQLKAETKLLAIPVRDDIRDRAARYGDRVTSGIRARFSSYVAFVDTSRKKSAVAAMRRPNFAGLLYDTAFEPAAEAHWPEVVAGYELMIDRLVVESGFE